MRRCTRRRRPSNSTAEYLWAESNGIRPATGQPGFVQVGRLDRLHRGVRIVVGGRDGGERGFDWSVAVRGVAAVPAKRFDPVERSPPLSSACRSCPRRARSPGPASRPPASRWTSTWLAPEADDGDRLRHAQQQDQALRARAPRRPRRRRATCRASIRRRSPADRSRASRLPARSPRRRSRGCGRFPWPSPTSGPGTASPRPSAGRRRSRRRPPRPAAIPPPAVTKLPDLTSLTLRLVHRRRTRR